jgi:hypothetical protein
MNLIRDKIKFYTNIILSGAIAFTPALWYLHQLNILDQSLFFTIAAITLLIIGRICLEIALLVEDYWIDAIVACKVKKYHHYEKIEDKGNIFNYNWYKYLLLNDNKFAYEIIAHLADRLLFLLSTSIGILIGSILLVCIYQYSILPYLGLFIAVITYVFFSFRRAISIAISLDFYRYYLLRNQQTIIHPAEEDENERLA